MGEGSVRISRAFSGFQPTTSRELVGQDGSVFGLGRFTGIAYVLTGFWLAWGVSWDGATASHVWYLILTLGGGALLLGGLGVINRSPWAGATLVSLGAGAGGVPLWGGFYVAVALAVLSSAYALRPTTTTAG